MFHFLRIPCSTSSGIPTIYTRMNRWSKNGVLDRVFEHLQRAQLIRIKLEAVSLDSTVVKVHPDGTGARKKTAPKTIWNDRLAIVRSSCASTRQGGRGRLRFAG